MPRANPASSVRAEWLAARAGLASRRLRPFRVAVAAAFAAVFLVVYAVRTPMAERAADTQRRAGQARATERDTLALVLKLRRERLALAAQDSMLHALQAQSERATALLSAGMQRERDSLRALSDQLAGALDRAAKAPLPTSYRALADTRALQPLGAVQVLMDTLALVERARQQLDPAEAPQSEFAQLSRRANAIGGSLQAIGRSRLLVIARQLAAIDAPGVLSVEARPADTSIARQLRDSVQLEVTRADSALRDARAWQLSVQARADSSARDRAARILGASPTIAAASVVLMVLVLGFTLAVLAEVRAPTIAHAREVERMTGLPVIGVAERFRLPREGRARLQSGTGVDPFRMAYLALTASGTRERVVCVTGDDARVTVAAASRLAVHAAADERATLLMDLTPGVPGASAFFGWRDEPGFTEAIAGVRLWREVARPVGASESLSLDVVPAGSPRQDTDGSVQDSTAQAEFATFLAEYDLSVLVALNFSAVEHAAVVCGNPLTIVTAQIAKTKLRVLKDLVDRSRRSGIKVHGILLIDAN